MNFLIKLVPYKSLYQFSSESLTAYWVLITIIIFVFYLWKLIKHTRQLAQQFLILSENFNEDNIEKIPFVNRVWEEYSSTLFSFNGGKKTYEYSSDYFNEIKLFHTSYNFKWLQSVPSVLVGIGILGTFVGLTFGISNFHTSNTKEIQSSITVLLSGMGTAFVSSIWGMLLSLLYSYLEKSNIYSLHSKVHVFCNLLDKNFLVTKNEERDLELQLQKNAIAEYFVYKDENNNLVKPANVLRDLFTESQKQSLALQSFSTDLAVKIEAGFENILSNQFQEKIVPVLDEIKLELQLFSKNVKDPASEMTQALVHDLKNVMSNMVEEFKTTIAGSTKSEMEGLASILASTSTNISEMPEILTNTTEQMAKLVETLGEKLNERVGELQIEQEILIDKQKENITLSDKFIDAINNSISKMNESSSSVSTVLNQFYDLMEMLKSTSSNMKTMSDNTISQSNQLRDSELRLIQHSESFLENNKVTTERIMEILQQALEVSSEYSEKFNIIESGLKSIFEQIQKGIIEYSGTIETSVRHSLEEYTKAITSSTESLSSSSSKLEDIMEELTDQLSKFNIGSR